MKKLFAVILSLGLIMAPVPVVSNAHADEAGSAKMKNQIITLVTSSVGANILVSCTLGTLQPSILLFTAGSLTHVLTEILAGKDIKKMQAKSREEVDAIMAITKSGGEVQKATIDKALSDEEEKLKFVDKRIKWLKIVSYMYTGAAAMAAIEAILELPPIFKTSVAGCGPLGGVTSKATYMGIVAAYTYQNMKAGGLIQSIGFLLLPIHSAAVPFMYQNSYARIATFGAAMLFIQSVIGDLNSIKSKLEANIQQLKLVRNQFLADTSDDTGLLETAGAGGGALNKNSTDASNKAYALKALPEGMENTRECASKGQGGGISVSAGGCKSPFNLSRPKFDSNFNVPVLRDFANNSADMANALAEGNIAAADVLAGKLGSQASRIKAIKDDAIKKLNEKLKESGKKFDYDGEVKKRYDSMAADFNKAAQQGGFNLANSGAGEAVVSETPVMDPNAGQINGAGAQAAIAVGASDQLADLSGIGEGGTETDSLAGEGRVATLEDSLGEFESNESDISKDSDVSIFKQLSNRYFLNYTKIFQRKEIDPPLNEAQPQN